MRSLFSCCILLHLAVLPLLSEEVGRRPFAIVGPDQGLPSGGVICIAQDEDGFIWLGSENGIIRYEGGQSRRWNAEDGLPSAYVARIQPAREGGLWAVTLRGLTRIRNGRIEPAQFGADPTVPVAGYIARDGAGRLWATSPRGIFVQKEGLRFESLSWKPAGRISTLVHGERSGAMFVAGEGGIQAFFPGGSTRAWGPPDGLPPGGPTLLAEDGDGRLWAGAGRTLVMKEQNGASFVDQSYLLPASLSPNSLAFTDRDGSVWLPTQDGTLRIAGETTERLNAAGGLPFRWVRTIFRDREGTLWVLGSSLARLQGGDRVRNYALVQGEGGEVVWFIARDRNGDLLLATDDGVVRMDSSGTRQVPGTAAHRIKALLKDREDTLWMVSSTGPVLWLPRGQEKAETAPLGDYGMAIHSVFEDSAGRVWFGHSRYGILRWDPSTRQLVQEVGPAFAGMEILSGFGMREDSLGRLWVGSSAGLLIREANGQWRLFTDKDGLRRFWVRGIALLPDGSAWIHYQEPYGLTRVRLDGSGLRVIEHRTAGQGLRSNLIYAVQADAHGHLWVTTDQGLDRLEPPLHVGRYDGMLSEDCSIQALLVEGQRIWVGTSSGLVRYEAAAAEESTAVPRAHILSVSYGNHRLEPPFDGLAPVPYRDASMEFRIAAPSYVNDREMRFQVRLLGLEDTWRNTELRMIRYAVLPGGRYRFEVRASNGEGAFGSPSGIDFVVRPPWWKTWWAYAIAALSFIGLVILITRLRVASLARSKAALEKLVTTRTSELRSRNEELSQALGRVKQLSGLLPICANCKKIRDDKGYWSQIEMYISEHSEADFSHGICPECVHLLYPEIAGSLKIRS